MSKKIQIRLNYLEDLSKELKLKYPEIVDFRILAKSLDARGAPRGKAPANQFSVEIIEKGESFEGFKEEFTSRPAPASNPIFIGAGPASLFGALRFAEYGIKTTIIERGDIANKRMLAISKYWRHGILNTENNVCFGEGGAGLFSDGKLITRIKSSFVKYVMRKFVEFGAPAETEYTSNPHLGSNKIRTIITKISDHLKSQGHNILYNSRVDELIYEGNKVIGVLLSSGEKLFSEHIILAAGHSCQKMYEHLQENNVAMVAKSFAVGVRIEHPRREIDKIQYGEFASDELIGAARYRLSYHNNKSDKGTYSFCMCPGGHVLATSTEENSLVCNGMSNFSRSSPWSNSALVVSVTKGKDFKESEILAGLRFQQEIEEKAYSLSLKQASGKELPAITVKEFLKNRLTKEELPKTSCPSKLFKADFNEIFPEFIIDHLRVALYEFDKNMPGFSSGKSVLIAPETRTSAPVTVLRDKKSLVSTSHFGLYPCGEGAGYAGGITSAAVDGIKVAESIMESIVKNT